MTTRIVLLSAALSIACTSVAVARTGPDDETTPGELIAQAERGATLLDQLLALRALGEIRDRESLRQWDVVGVLCRLARHKHPRVAIAAIDSLGRLHRFDPTAKTKSASFRK